jgi:hypothetical protein
MKKSIPRIIDEMKNESNTDYKTEIPTPEELKILEELRKHKFLYAILKDNPEYSLKKINRVMGAFYS